MSFFLVFVAVAYKSTIPIFVVEVAIAFIIFDFNFVCAVAHIHC